MSKKSKETGHYINVANGNTLIKHIYTFKESFTPTKEAIQLKNLEIYHTRATGHINQVQEAKNGWSLVVDNRQFGYRNIRKFSTRIMGILEGTNLSAKNIETARSINAKIQSVRLIKPKETELDDETKDELNPEEEKEQPKRYSVSRQSYDSLYENFSDLVNFLSQAEGYDPNIDEFKIDSLKAYAANLLELTNAMDEAEAKVKEARRMRNEFMYAEEVGYVDVMLSARKFIKGMFGAKAPQTETANAIRFKNIRR